MEVYFLDETLKHEKSIFVFYTVSPFCRKKFALATPFRKVVTYQKKDVCFTVFTDGAMEMESRSSGQYTEDPFFMAVERNLPVPKYKIRNKGKWIYWMFSPKLR